MPDYTLRVNGASRTVRTDADTPLLYVLRNNLELNGPKFGCGLSQCGSCTVHVDGRAVRSCVTPVSSLAGKAVNDFCSLCWPVLGAHGLRCLLQLRFHLLVREHGHDFCR